MAPKSISEKAQDLTSWTLKEASDLLRSRAASPVDLTQACLKRVEKYNSTLHAFITVTAEQALEAAREAESELRRGNWRGRLRKHGVHVRQRRGRDRGRLVRRGRGHRRRLGFWLRLRAG